MEYRLSLEEIMKFPKNDADISELEDATISVSKNLIRMLQNVVQELDRKEPVNELVLESVKHLKSMCTKGPSLQNLIINTKGMVHVLKELISGSYADISPCLGIKSFQLVANLIVKNEWSQEKIWNSMNDVILKKLESKDSAFINVAAMIVYNMILGKKVQIDELTVFKICLCHIKAFLKLPTNHLPDFVSILSDYLICKSSYALDIYKNLEAQEQKIALFYIHDYIENETNDILNEALFHHLTEEFKKKSDCILKTVTTYVDSIDPQIVVSLLDIISTATSQHKYIKALKDDRSLFLNIGCLLQSLHKLGKTSGTIFSPIQKLEALVPNSDVNGDFEKEISFSFKTKLVKSICNLSHKNKRNQELARELEIMLSIFECTNSDARNPLIKEWSIMTLRNLCEDNLENQEIVRNLTKIENAENPVLKEMGLDSGILRIGKQ